MRRALVLLLVLPLIACGGSDGEDLADVPKGVTFRVEQARQDLQNRHFQLQVVNGGDKPLTVSSAKVTSGRLDKASRYVGPATIPAGGTVNLTMSMAPASCPTRQSGTGIDATARVTYRVGDGKEVTSVVRPKDHYGSVGLFMKRDCAESTIADLRVDDTFPVRGTGRDSVLEVGITFTARAKGGPVQLGPVDGTTLLKPAPGTNIEHELVAGSGAYHAVLKIIPNRCDIHVVAEDRTGATMPLHVDSKRSGKAFFFLRFTEPQKKQIFDFVAQHCGFGVEQDPLNAP
jgi:hypothetical protein